MDVSICVSGDHIFRLMAKTPAYRFVTSSVEMRQSNAFVNRMLAWVLVVIVETRYGRSNKLHQNPRGL
jgi:hypothetical protein